MTLPGIREGVTSLGEGGGTYNGAVSAGGAFFTRGSGGAGRSGLTGAASGAGLTAGSFATFLAAGAGGAGEADVTLGRSVGGVMPSG